MRMTLRRPFAGALIVLSTGGLGGCGDDDDGSGPDIGEPARLAFVAVPTTATARATMPAIEVEVRDSRGNLVPTATNGVTLSFEANPGALLLHASGINVSQVIELVDPVTPVVLTPPLAAPVTAQNEILSLVHRPSTNRVLASNRSLHLLSFDPVTGARDTLGTIGEYLKGLTFEAGASGRLIGSANQENELYQIDPATGAPVLLGAVSIPGETVEGFNGLATDPTSGTIYSAVRLDSTDNRVRTLVTLNVASLTGSVIGTLPQNGVAELAFLPDGTLLAVTGDGGANPEQLWVVNKSSAAMTHRLTMGNGSDGEAIAAIPARLTGTLARAAVGGVAVFDDLRINAPAAGYTLRATAVGLTSTVSGTFTVAAP